MPSEIVNYDMSLFKLRKNYAKELIKKYNFNNINHYLKNLNYVEDNKSLPLKQQSEFLANNIFEKLGYKNLPNYMRNTIDEYNIKIKEDYNKLKELNKKLEKEDKDFFKRIDRKLTLNKDKKLGKLKGGKRIRKHKGINQTTGRLKKGYKYSGKKLKNGLSEIIKV